MTKLSATTQKMLTDLHSPTKFKLFLLRKLPMGFLAKLRIVSLDTQQAQISVPYNYLNQNPFKSTYFAVLSMAAEMSTGILCMLAASNAASPISMLVTNLQAEFVKKATSVTTFTCVDGQKFFDAVEQTLATGEGVQVVSTTVGKNENGEEIARFTVTWSMKKKRKS